MLRLLLLRWEIFWSGYRYGTARDRFHLISVVVFASIIAWFVGEATYWFLYPFIEASRGNFATYQLLSRLPVAGLFASFILLLFSAITVGLQIFYTNRDLHLLLTTPLSARAIFVAKFIEALVTNASIFVIVGGPALLAYALVTGNITTPFILYLIIGLISFASIPTALGVLLSLLLMRLLPVSRMRDLLGALGIVLFSVVYLAFSVGVRNATSQSVRTSAYQLAQFTKLPILHYGPWAWAGDALGSGQHSMMVWVGLGLLVGLGTLVIWLSAMAAEKLHYRGWTVSQETYIVLQRANHSSCDRWERHLSALPGPIRGEVLKNIRSLGRDMRQLSMFLIPSAVIIVMLYNISQIEVQEMIHPALFFMFTLFVMLLPISFRLAMAGFMLENRTIWMCIASPADTLHLLVGKYLYALALSLPLALASTAGYIYVTQAAEGEAVIIMMLVLMAVIGFCGIGVGAGAIFHEFNADSPRLSVPTGARMATFFIQFVFVMILYGTSAALWLLHNRGVISVATALSLGAPICVLITAVSVVVPLMAGSRRIKKLEF